MKTLTSVFVALALLAGSGAALADPGHDHDRRGHDRDDHHDRGRWHDRDEGRRGRDRGDHWERRYYSDRHYYGHPRWARGYRYDGPMYVVDNYNYYRLAPPPYGYRWVREDNNYLLVSIGNNLILDMVIR